MTVQPLDSGYQDYSQKGAIPDIADTPTKSGYAKDLTPRSSYEMYPHKYTARSQPVVVNTNFWGKNGFYMNGPAGNPFDHAVATRNAVDAYTQSWTSQAKIASLESFSKLLSQYGSTNSPGTLWALANSNLDPENPAVQKMLAVDAQASAEEYGRSQPVRGASPAATQEASWTDNLWQPVEFVSRNAFAALSMPMEAVQGAIRGIGGQLTEETGPDISGAVAELGSLIFPPISLWADRVRGDNEFINPWEQTEFGQTLLSAAGGAGFSAFTTKQAGLDIQKAKDEILQDPAVAALSQTEDGMAQINALAEKTAQEKGYYSEPGWFIDETSIVGEAQRRATFEAWAIPGKDDQLTAWTLGRGIFSNVGGPDWVGYGVASGLVDAAAAVLFDPTIIGSKFGLPSKAVKGLSTLARGADGAILIGKEKRAAESAYSVAMLQMQSAQAKAAAGAYDDAARKAAAELRVTLGREPSTAEIQAIVGEPPVVDPTDLAIMDLVEQANTVKQAKITDLTTETVAAVKPQVEFVASQARDARRSVATAERAQRVLDKDVVSADVISDPTGARSLWQDYISYTYLPENGVYSVDNRGYYRFTEDALGYDRNGPGTGFADPARAQQFSDLSRRQAAWAMENGFDDPGSYEAATAFLDQIDQIGSRSVRSPKVVPADQVERDTARLLTNDAVDSDLEALAQRDIMGANLMDAPGKNTPAVGRVDGVESVIYWTGKQEPKLLLASDVVPSAARTRIGKALQDILNRPEMRLVDEVVDTESMAGQVASRIDAAADPRRALEDLMTLPNLSWGRLLDEVSRVGLDGVFDDILRSLPRGQRADGIKGLADEAGRGVWLGDHPSMSAYQISDTAREAGLGIRGTDDIDAALANLNLTATEQVGVGFRNLGVDDLEQIRNSALSSATSQMDGLRNFRSDRIVEATRQETALRAAIDELDTKFSDPAQALKETIGYQVGLRNSRTGSMTLDEKGVRSFLFGSGPTSFLANRTLDALSDFIPEADRLKALDRGADSDFYKGVLTRAMGELHIITNGKWAPETYRAIATNAIEGGGRDGLMNVLAPRLGIDVTKGSVSRTVNLVDSDGKRYFRSWRAPSPSIARALGQMPTPRKINLQNADEVAESIMLYGRYAKVDEGTLANLIGRVLEADGTMNAVGVNRNAMADTFNEISKTLLAKIDESGVAGSMFKGQKGAQRLSEIRNAIHSSTRLWLGGLTDESSADLARYASDSAIPRVITSDGKEITLPSIQIDTELAQGFLGLPSVESWDAALNRFVLAMNRSELATNIVDYGRRFFDNFFRTSLLALRVSYIIRNTAEMQVRMFLNGHKSVLSDPMTLVGMTVGNLNDAKAARRYKESYDAAVREIEAAGGVASKAEVEAMIGPKPTRKFADLFAPYKDTVLDTAFEVGTDEALAVANHVEDYFALIRQAHSLTDPRVYNSAIRTGWRPIGYGTPGFNQGWAHELIMLQKSGIARLVLRDPDPRYAGVVNSAGKLADEDMKVMALMDSPEYDDLRKLLIGADANFKEILSDPQATRQYLFDSPNSVYNRIQQFTAGNPELLNYIRTGNLRYGNGEVLNLGRIAVPQDRVKALGTVLENHFNGKADGFDWAAHFIGDGTNPVKVPWVENIDARPGITFFNKFFDWANKIERLGAVGPEFRMAYWDKIAELAPGLRAQDVPRALKAARTTLSPLKRMKADGALDNFGVNHPAFSALKKAADTNGDGLLTLDEIHGIASSHAAEVVTGLFYDAARRNNMWNALRLVFPFGQAWGNTINTWTKLGKKAPIQVYKAQKAFNALLESGSSAVYEAGSQMGLYGQYAPGFAPWEQDTNGGFFYTDSFGETSFMYPVLGRAAAMPLNVWSQFVGGGSAGISEVAMQSPASSLNLALGADSIFPGVGPLAALPLATGVLPDNELTAKVRQIAAPFGEKNIIESMVPSWFSKVLGGIDALPVIGNVVGPWVDALAPASKNKGLRDAMMILSTSGNYKDWATNDKTARQLRDDAAGLASALILTTGLFQNVMPSTPYTQATTPLAGDKFKGEMEGENTALYTISMLNSLFQQYRARNGFDDTAAREEYVKDFGPAALFATTGDWKNLSRVPTSQALEFARKNPEIAKANLDMFTLFFPQGDSSDVAATMWIRKYGMGDRVRKNKDEIFGEIVGFLERTQRFRIDSMEANGIINENEATAAREDLKERYLETGTTQSVVVDKTEEMDKLNSFVNRYPEIKDSQAGQAFLMAWTARDAALRKVREQTGRDNAGLGSQTAAPVLDWYLQRIGDIETQYPDFKLLAGKFRREWE